MSVCFVSTDGTGLAEEGEVVGGEEGGTEGGGDMNAVLAQFWDKVMEDIRKAGHEEYKNQVLPLARVKKIMKLDEEVKMISAEAPLLFAKAAEIFIHELTLRAWAHTEDNKRRTLQRNDIAMAIIKSDQFDFLIDIVPRQEVKPSKSREEGRAAVSQDQVHYYFQLAQQHQAALQQPQPAQQQAQQQVPQQAPVQLLQQVVTAGGEIQQIPIQLTPAQMNLLRMQMQNNSGQPLIIQTAPQQQLIQVQPAQSPQVYLAQVPQDQE